MKRLPCICTFLIVFQLFSYAQGTDEQIIDSIRYYDPTNLDSLYYRLFLKYRTEDLELAERYALLTFENANALRHYELLIKAGNALGHVHTENKRLDEAERYYLSALETAKEINYENYIIFLSNNLGNLYNTKIFQYDKAIEYYLESLYMSQKLGRPKDQVAALNNIGLVYNKLGNYEEALTYYLDVIKIKKENGLEQGIFLNYNNLGFCYIGLKDYAKAIESFTYTLENCIDCPRHNLAEAYLGLGYTYFELKQFSHANEYLSSAKTLYENEKDLVKISSVDYFLAKIQFETGHLEQALLYLDTSQAEAEEAQSIERLKNNYELYADIYEKQGEYIMAFENLKRFILLKDSIFNEELAENLKNAHIEYQRIQTDEVLQGKDIQIAKNKLFAYSLSIILFLLLIILVFIYREAVNRRNLNKKLDNLVKEKTKELLAINIKLTKSRKDLDTFLYKTSHDIRGPLATLMGLTNLAKLETKDKETSNYLEKISYTANNLTDVINRLTSISQISSQPLKSEKIDIYATVDSIVRKIRENTKYNIQFMLNDDSPDFIITDKILFESIIYSLLDNSFKFYDPSEKKPYVALNIEDNGVLEISVKDNGIGIDANYKERIFDIFFVANMRMHGAGIGLFQAMLATERLNGDINLKRNRKPTLFQVTIPNNKNL